MTARWLGVALALVLAGCADTSPRGHLGCASSCNRDYDMCTDSTGASRSLAGSYFGAGAACDREMASCLKQCEAAAAAAEVQSEKRKADKTAKTSEAP